MSGTANWSVEFDDGFGEGTIAYREAAGTITFRWALQFGSRIVAEVTPDPPVDWAVAYPWADVDVVFHRVAAEVVRRRAPNCTAEVHPGLAILVLAGGSGA